MRTSNRPTGASVGAQAEAAQAGEESVPDKIRAVCRSIAEGIRSPGFRGCAFLNAAAEYPDPDHPVIRAALAHRQWFLDTDTGLMARTGSTPAEAAGRHLVLLRDGAMASGCLFDPQLVCGTFLRGVEEILRTRAV